MQAHQDTWSKQKPYALQLYCWPNVLNHTCSDPSTSGQQAIRKLQYADVYSSDSDDNAEMGVNYTIEQSIVPKNDPGAKREYAILKFQNPIMESITFSTAKGNAEMAGPRELPLSPCIATQH
ncbi:hypothetical protein PR048_023314 [Dryococelus australis]|uniref:Uncharacterized protein n=1 Tax=Dryococelus australis TaxID=614101 RepID=A0ABQ9GTR0_9NEOP|nr:hypothetical protein PR048_023314 [Dryococelus australis]